MVCFVNGLGQALCKSCRENTHRAKMFSTHDIVQMSKRLADKTEIVSNTLQLLKCRSFTTCVMKYDFKYLRVIKLYISVVSKTR